MLYMVISYLINFKLIWLFSVHLAKTSRQVPMFGKLSLQLAFQSLLCFSSYILLEIFRLVLNFFSAQKKKKRKKSIDALIFVNLQYSVISCYCHFLISNHCRLSVLVVLAFLSFARFVSLLPFMLFLASVVVSS